MNEEILFNRSIKIKELDMFKKVAWALPLLLGSSMIMAHGDIDRKYDPSQIHTPQILDHVVGPTRVITSPGPMNETKVVVKLLRNKDGLQVEQVIETPDLEINCDLKSGSSRMTNKYFQIKQRSVYEIQGPIECGSTNTWIFDAESIEGQVMGIHDLSIKAVRQFKNMGLIKFWKKKITMRWPSDGDYYNWNTVNITRGDHWDVVGHEIGHAIYAQAKIGRSEGGRHRIDECYTGTLALSEGWASFFSAWLSIDLKDSDAKFEFMVPRRAPLTIESIPSDVCKGPTNEWRVTGFLWDIIDHSYDGESSQEAFSKIWKITLNQKFRDIGKLASELTKSIDPMLVKILWEKNFLTDFKQ